MLRIFEPLDFKDAKPKRPQQAYVVQPGDTLAGIALRHGMKESEVRAMNNLWEGNVFSGQQLALHRKMRSQSMPQLPGVKEFAERVDRQREHIKASEQRRRAETTTNQAEEEPVADDEPLTKEAPPRESKSRGTLDVIMEQSPQVGFFSSLLSVFGKANSSPTMKVQPPQSPQVKRVQHAPRLKTRSYSERLPTNQEEQDDVYALPKLRGATESDVLSDARYGPKLVPKIEAFLPMRLRGDDWTLLYSLAQHGSSLHTLMRKVRGHRSTLVVVETCRGEIFGGFATTAWANSLSYYGTGESFVFTNTPAFEVFNWKKTNSMFLYSNDESIAMGGGGGFAWVLNSDLSRGSTSVSETFENRPLTTEAHFDVANVEVWGFAMF